MNDRDKKRVAAKSLKVGDLCYPRSARPTGSFLDTRWRVIRIDEYERLVVVKIGNHKARFIKPWETVLIDAPPTSDI